jgi:hypothetical protein
MIREIEMREHRIGLNNRWSRLLDDLPIERFSGVREASFVSTFRVDRWNQAHNGASRERKEIRFLTLGKSSSTSGWSHVIRKLN